MRTLITPSAPVARWPFEGNVNDASGNGHNGTLQNTVTPFGYVPGKFGQGISLDGLNDHVTVPGSAVFKWTGQDFSAFALINRDPTDDASYVISKPWNGFGQYNWQIVANADRTLSVTLLGATSFALTPVNVLSDSVWHSVGFTVEASTKIVRVYYDGVQVAQGTHAITSWVPTSGDNNEQLAIGTLYPYGSGWAGVSAQAFKGLIDEVYVFNRVVAISDALLHYTGELGRLSAGGYTVYVQSESQDADGTWQSHNTLQGTDWLTAFKYRGDADTPYVTGSVELARADRTLSMAPLITGSLINRNAAAAYAPFLDVGRRARVKTAVVAQGMAPLTTDYRYVFDGYIDKVGIGGRDDNAITIECRDLGALLVDTDIEVVRGYGSSGGTAVETVMQQILDDNLGAGAVTLYTPVTPNWFIHEFSQKLTSVMEALRALAKQIGYEVRYVYDASDVLRLTFYAPDRAKTIPDYTIGPVIYWDIPQLDLEITDVRNAWTVEFIDRATGNKLTSIATDAGSIAKYKRRPAKIAYGYSSNIDSQTEADKMTAAAVADTSLPKALEVVDLNYWPIVDIADFVTLLSNGEHYDTDQQRAIFAYEHELRDGDGTTTITTRGKPSGGYDTWMSLVGGILDGPSLTVIDTPGANQAANHTLTYTGSWDTIQLSINGAAWIVPGASPLTVTPNAAGGATKVYSFRAIKNGQIVTQNVSIDPPAPLPPQAVITHLNTETDDTQWFLQVNAVAGSGGGGTNLTWSVNKKIGFAAETTIASGNATTLPSAQTIARDPRSDTIIRVSVTDAITGLTDTARITVPSARPEINSTAHHFRNRPFDDGSQTVRASDLLGQAIHSAVADARGYAVNTHYNTAVHTADNISPGALLRVPKTASMDASANMDLGGSAWVNRNLGNVSDTAARFAAPVAGATSDLGTFVASSGVTLRGNTAEAIPGAAWNEQVYSAQGHFNGAYVETTVLAGAGPTMFGINNDPTTDASYTSINHAWYITGGGNLEIYESASALGVFSTYVAGDVLGIMYDGGVVKYIKNGTVFRAVYIGLGVTYYFDSSFHANGKLGNIRWIPTSPSVVNFSSQIIRSIQWNDARFSLQSSSSDGRVVETSNTYHQATSNYLSMDYQRGIHTLDNVDDGGTYSKVASVSGNLITANSSTSKGRARGRKTAGQTLTTAALTQMTLDTADYVAGIGVTRSGNQFIINDAIGTVGAWVIMVTVSFAANATGDRHVELRQNNVLIPGGIVHVRAAANAATRISIAVTVNTPALSDAFDAYASQDSGGNLALVVAECSLTMQHVW